MSEKEPQAERDFRSFMTFGTKEGRPPDDTLDRFYQHSLTLSSTVPIAVQNTFMALDHDMKGGSDHLFVIDGLVLQAAAEVWAAETILRGQLALLTIFHHARALYEAHAITYWLLGDVQARSLRALKKALRERRGFEEAAKTSIGVVVTDIAAGGQRLLDDGTVREIPKMHELVKGHPVLEFDYAIFWKYASAHAHPSSIGTGEVDVESERTTIMQMIAGVIRHSCGVYRHVAEKYGLDLGPAMNELKEAEEFSRYRFPGAPVEPRTT